MTRLVQTFPGPITKGASVPQIEDYSELLPGEASFPLVQAKSQALFGMTGGAETSNDAKLELHARVEKGEVARG